MVNFYGGFLNILFFGGGLLFVYFNKRAELNWKLVATCLIFVAGGILMIMDSDVMPGKTVEMVTGAETFNNKDTIIAGDFEYTVTDKGTANVLEDFGAETEAQGEYFIFEVEIKNNSNYPFKLDTLMSTPFYLLNGERYYEVNKDISRSLSNEELSDHNFWSRTGSTNSGNSVTGYVVFDVPKEIIQSKETQFLIFTDDSAPNDIYITIN